MDPSWPQVGRHVGPSWVQVGPTWGQVAAGWAINRLSCQLVVSSLHPSAQNDPAEPYLRPTWPENPPKMVPTYEARRLEFIGPASTKYTFLVSVLKCTWNPNLNPTWRPRQPSDPPLGGQDGASWGRVGRHVGPSRYQDGPSWVQVSAKLEKLSPLGAKIAQVGPKVSKNGGREQRVGGRGAPP